MAFMAAALPYISAASSILGAFGQIQAGKEADAQAKYQSKQLEQQAGQERATSQRKANELRRRATIAESRALALAAASGGGASDPGITNLMAGIAGEGELAAQHAIYEGEERARGSEMSAAAKRYEGKSAKRAGYIGATSSLLAGASSAFGKGLTEKYAPSPQSSSPLTPAPDWWAGYS